MTAEHDANLGGRASSRIIKRYANRKLYDTRDSRYITLQQIAELVRGGEDVTIIDNTTKEDITHVTLAQIVYEEERNQSAGSRGNSIQTLRSFIQERSEKIINTLQKNPAFKLIAKRDSEAAEEEVEENSPNRFLRLWNPRELMSDVQRLADERIKGILSHAVDQLHALSGEVGRLQNRIEELEQTLAQMSKPDSGKAESGAKRENSAE